MWSTRTFLFAFSLCLSATAWGQAPTLVTEPTSTRAIAVEAVTLKPQPFSMRPTVDFAGDGFQRIVLFAQDLTAGDVKVLADAGDGKPRTLAVESVSGVPGFPDLSQLTIRLPADLPANGDLLFKLTVGMVTSNSVRVGVGHNGDGPPETGPAPRPYVSHALPVNAVPGLIMNLRMSAFGDLNSGASIARWPDSSAAKNDAVQPESAKQPLYVKTNDDAFVRTDGNVSALLPSVQLTNIRTAIFVIRHRTNLQASPPLLSDHSSASLWGGGGAHHEGNLFDYEEYPFGSSTSDMVLSGTVRINGRAVDAKAAPKPGTFEVVSIVTTGPMPADMILDDRFSVGRAWDGDVKEIAIFDRALSSAELDGVERDLRERNHVGPLPGLLVFDGNSLTASGAYSFKVIETLNSLGRRYDWLQYGVGSQTTLDMLADAHTQIDTVIDPARPINIVLTWEGTNDLLKGISGQEAFDHMKTYCLGRRAAGAKVVLIDAMPGKPTFAEYFLTWDPQRKVYNELLAQHWREFADGFISLSADPQLGCADCPDNRDLFVDGVHLTPKGYGIVAERAKIAVMELTSGN
jgi:lysophospholipase L1-like esterase